MHTSMQKPGILVVGSANIDLTVNVDALPSLGETVLGGTFASAIGGKGANQATAACRAGGNVVFLGATGQDKYGEAIRQHFAAEGIRTIWAEASPDVATGVALIMVDAGGNNCIAVAPGANSEISEEDVLGAPFSACRYVLLSLEIPMPIVLEAARRGRAAGCKIVLNPAPAARLSDELLREVHILVPNEHEVNSLSGNGGEKISTERAARRFFDLGGEALIVTLGERGAEVIQPGRHKVVSGRSVKAVDTVGAGDCFCGVLVASLADGCDLLGAVSWANRAASQSVETHGAISSFPKLFHEPPEEQVR